VLSADYVTYIRTLSNAALLYIDTLSTAEQHRQLQSGSGILFMCLVSEELQTLQLCAIKHFTFLFEFIIL